MTAQLVTDLGIHPEPVPSVAVAICAHTDERWIDLEHAIQSAIAQRSAPDEIVVVVDHNPELLNRLRQRHADGPVSIEPNRHQRGLSGARNTAVDLTHADIIAFLDDDAAADPDWLGRLLPLYSNPDVQGVGGASIPRWDDGRPSWFPEEFDWVVGCTYRGMPTRTARMRNMIGSNMSFRREAIEIGGGFDPDLGRNAASSLPAGGEETSLCIRVAGAAEHAVFVFAPDALVHHRVRSERATWQYFVRRCWAEGVSKAAASAKLGGTSALSSEKHHVISALPRGLVRGVADSMRQRSLDGLARSSAIGVGLTATVAGFVRGRIGPPPP